MDMEIKILAHTPDSLYLVNLACITCVSESPDSWIDIIPSFRGEDEANGGAAAITSATGRVKSVIESGHHSVLEHVSITFMVKNISRAATHQLVRHRMASFSQQSQRYVNMENCKFYIPDSVVTGEESGRIIYEIVTEETKTKYKTLLKHKINKEDARYILPNATYSNIMVTMNLRELRHVAGLRLCNRAQKEIRTLFTELKHKIAQIEDLHWFVSYIQPKCIENKMCTETRSCGLCPTLSEYQEAYNKINSTE